MRDQRTSGAKSVITALLLSSTCIGYGAVGIIPFESLVQQSDAIVLGRVATVDLVRTPLPNDPNQPAERPFVTRGFASFAVDRVIKGAAHESIVIEFPIGEDSPAYEVDEQVVAFLERVDDDRFSTAGLMQGKFVVTKGRVERENVVLSGFLARIERVLSR